MPAIPYLIVKGAADAIAFYAKAFGAVQELRLDEPGSDRVGHAELRIGDGRIMLADEFPEYGFLGPITRGGTTVTIAMQVDDVDAWAARAEAAGARIDKPPTNEFYGERRCRLTDPFGHAWNLSTPTERLTEDEMRRRYEELERA